MVFTLAISLAWSTYRELIYKDMFIKNYIKWICYCITDVKKYATEVFRSIPGIIQGLLAENTGRKYIVNFTHNNYLETHAGDTFHIGDIVTVEYYDEYYGKQTITGRLWFQNEHMLFISSNTCDAEIFAVNVISIKHGM